PRTAGTCCIPSPDHPQRPDGSAQDGGGGTGVVQAVYTDDVATKLSDRHGVRRRCFNCYTTDTSTWRSNLSPGKVLCNKCGLFERTHSCPRPEQCPQWDPHKRGPIASLTLQSRSPPQAQPYQNPRTLPPPGSGSGSYPPLPPRPPPTAPPAPTLPPSPGNGQQSGSALHRGTPQPQALNPSPKLPGVDSLRPASWDGRREREREECVRDERRDRSPK
ncbi:hypothetical protein B0H13DRAFT_465710, partial [Mycena leptocephala]